MSTDEDSFQFASSEALIRAFDIFASERAIKRLIYRMGYCLEEGDFDAVGSLLARATLGADKMGRKAYRGEKEIAAQYARTNIVYPEGGRRTKEIYSNVLIDLDVNLGAATSLTSFTVAQQVPGEELVLLVAGRYEDEWERADGAWHWTDRYIVTQYHNDLDKHMHTGTQPYN